MFDWLFEGRTSVYVVLAALVVFLLLAWWQMRKRWILAAAASAAAFIGLYALLDKMVETDREQIVRKVTEMAAAVSAHNLDAAFAHFSDRFRSAGGKSKQEMRETAQMYLDRRLIERVQVWDILVVGRPERERGLVHVFFSAKTHNGQDFLTDCDAVFTFQPERGWQMSGLRLLKPQSNEEWNLQI